MILLAAVVWPALFGLYLFLAGTVDAVEIAAGLLFSGLGAAFAVGLRRVAHRRMAVILPPPRALIRPVVALLPETFAVGRQLLATISGTPGRQYGTFVQQPFDPGRDDDAASATRRAVAVLGVSLAPGGIAIRGDRSDTMILHALPPKPASSDRRWPA